MFMKAAARRQLYRQETRAEIVKAARAIFVRKGFEGFSMRTLACAVGYSPAALYLQFASKEELFDVLVEEAFVHLHEALSVLLNERGKNPVEQLKRGPRIYVESIEASQRIPNRLCRAKSDEETVSPPSRFRPGPRSHESLSGQLGRGQARIGSADASGLGGGTRHYFSLIQKTFVPLGFRRTA